MVKALEEMTLSRDMSSNEHVTNSMKKNIHKYQKISSIVMELNRKKLLARCLKDLCRL